MASKGWQNQERLVASWLGTMRNPLSGRNNRNDDGSRRLGDVLYKESVIEIKRRNNISMANVHCVRDLARAARLPWLLLEFRTGTADLVKLTCDHDTARFIMKMLDKKWKLNAKGQSEEGII